jgi:hypothetical protein
VPRPKRKRIETYTSSHVHQLVTGHDFFGEGFGYGPEALAAMRAAWRTLREKVYEAHAARRRRHPQPFGAVFDLPKAEQAAAIEALGLAEHYGIEQHPDGP